MITKFLVAYVTQYGGTPRFHNQLFKIPGDHNTMPESDYHHFRKTYGHLHQTEVTILSITKLDTP
jgi:hypothetical protein